jgi:hypothetical protein
LIKGTLTITLVKSVAVSWDEEKIKDRLLDAVEARDDVSKVFWETVSFETSPMRDQPGVVAALGIEEEHLDGLLVIQAKVQAERKAA